MSGSTNHWKVILYKNSVHLAKYIHGVMLINPNPKTQALSLSPGLHCKPMMTLWNQIGHTTNQSKASMWGGVYDRTKKCFFEELFKRNFTRAKFHWDFWIDNHWKVILYKNPTLLYRMVLERAFGSSVSMHFAKSKKWFQYRTGRKQVCHFLLFLKTIM